MTALELTQTASDLLEKTIESLKESVALNYDLLAREAKLKARIAELEA